MSAPTWTTKPARGMGLDYHHIEGPTRGPLLLNVTDAEAQLNAAAPEMLAALRGMLHRYPENSGTYTPEGARARAVLARLTGWTS